MFDTQRDLSKHNRPRCLLERGNLLCFRNIMSSAELNLVEGRRESYDKLMFLRIKFFRLSDSASSPGGKITSTLFPTTRKPIADSLGLIQKEVGRGRDVLSIRPKSCRQFSCGREVGRNWFKVICPLCWSSRARRGNALRWLEVDCSDMKYRVFVSTSVHFHIPLYFHFAKDKDLVKTED